MNTIKLSTQDQELGSYRILAEAHYEKLLTLVQKIDGLFTLLMGNDEIDLHDGVGFLMGEQTEQLASCIRGMKTITLLQDTSGKSYIQNA